MIHKITNDKELVIKNQTYYFGLAEYPHIQDWEWNNILAFLCYEKSHGRTVEVVCENEGIVSLMQEAAHTLKGTEYIPPNEKVIEEFVYHATDVKAAKKIVSGGKLLSATEVYGKTGEELAFERRDCEWRDPADFYEYIMFGWGTHPVGDYVVLSEKFPSEDDLQKGNFEAGVRFYFKYADILKHKGHIFDGYHPIKVKKEVILSEYLFACIVPEQYKSMIGNCIPKDLSQKVHYLPQRGISLQEWNDKVVKYVRGLDA